jgi:DNA-binding CsgD family transcriptional regulator/DNA-binding MarR family transcriptional regulator
MAAVRDFPTMQRWEVLRRHLTPMSAQEFASACSVTHSEALASLDLLLDGGFVVRHRATARRRHTTYTVAADEIILVFDSDNEEQRRWINSQATEFRRFSRDAIDSHITMPPRGGGVKRSYGEFYRAPTLTPAEVERACAILQQAVDAIAELEREALARSRRDKKSGSVAAESSHAYMLAVNFVAVDAGVLPLPKLAFMESEMALRRSALRATSPKSLLTARELEVATSIASGKSRPETAKALGVSANTVASATKRIYAKLGVRNRAEFTSRMAGQPSP